MKILIYMPFCAWVPHLATDLEIAAKHIEKGDEVHIIQCSGDLASCEPNPNHFKTGCFVCKSRRNRGLKLIRFSEQNRHELALKNFTQNVEIPDFTSIQDLKQFKINDVDFGMAVASTLISMVREPDPDVDQFKNFIDKNLSTSIAVYDAIRYHLQETQPDIFYLFNGRFASLRPALRAAQDLDIKTFVHDRAGILQRYLLIEETYPHDIEYQKAQIEKYWNEEPSLVEKENLAREWFKDRRGGKDQAWFSFTKSQKYGSLPEGFNPSKRNIAIFISSDDEFESIAGWQNPIYGNQIEAINAIITADIDDNIVLYLRIHPNLRGLKNSQMQQLAQLKAGNLVIIPAVSKINSYQLMDACEKVITFGSTMGIESVFWGKPSILVGRAFYEDLDGCYVPEDHTEFIHLINSRLNPKPDIGSLKFGYFQTTFGHPYVYYSPESVRGGKFMGKYINNPIAEKIKDKIMSTERLSIPIMNLTYYLRKLTWKFRDIH